MAVTYDLLTISNQVTAELGLPQLASVVGNTDLTARQILALANRAGDELYQQQDWTFLQNYQIINILAPTYSGNATLVAGSTNVLVTTTAGITAGYFAITGIEVPTAARITAVVDGFNLTMDEPSTFTGVTPVVIAQDTFDLPNDFKSFLDRTMWDRTNHWELLGPISPQVDEWQRSGIVSVGPRKRWRQVGRPNQCWRIWPPPTATTDYPATLVFEYISNYWASSVSGTAQPYFTADTDVPIVDGQAIVLTVKWRLWQIRGFSYAALQQEALDYISTLSARDAGNPDLTLGRRRLRDDYLITPYNVPDGSWPSGSS